MVTRFLFCFPTSNAFLVTGSDLACDDLPDERAKDHHPEVDCHVTAAVSMMNKSFARGNNVVKGDTQPNVLQHL